MIKKIFTSLVAVALCCLPVVSAQCADAIKVSLKKGLSPNDVSAVRVMPPGASGDFYQTKDARGVKEDYAYAWYMVRIPLQVAAKSSSGDPLFVDEMKVTVYVAMLGGKNADRPFLLKREITYVDVPLNPRANDDGTVVNVGVFLSPLDAARICGPEETSPDLSKRLGAVAVTAKFRDSSCNNTAGSPSLVVSRELKSKFSGTWWKNEKAGSAGATLKSIAETPFAAYYSPLFPPTSPMYGSDGSAAPAPSADTTPTTITPTTGDTTPPAADDATATDTPAETDSTTGGKKKKRKNRRNN